MPNKKSEFIGLIDSAITLSQELSLEEEPKRLATVVDVLQRLKHQVLDDKLEPSKGVLTLGLSREVADWIDSLDSPLLKAVGLIEQYYQQYF
jgi:hypothetical protein